MDVWIELLISFVRKNVVFAALVVQKNVVFLPIFVQKNVSLHREFVRKNVILIEQIVVMSTLTSMQETFVSDIRTIINNARITAVRSVGFCRVQMYWQLGRRIFEEEQQGKERADYGSYLIKNLALRLEPEYGSGFGHRQLERARQFYREYPIASAVRSQLNWAQYRLLMQISDPDKREYYELEAVNNAWTAILHAALQRPRLDGERAALQCRKANQRQ